MGRSGVPRCTGDAPTTRNPASRLPGQLRYRDNYPACRVSKLLGRRARRRRRDRCGSCEVSVRWRVSGRFRPRAAPVDRTHRISGGDVIERHHAGVRSDVHRACGFLEYVGSAHVAKTCGQLPECKPGLWNGPEVSRDCLQRLQPDRRPRRPASAPPSLAAQLDFRIRDLRSISDRQRLGARDRLSRGPSALAVPEPRAHEPRFPDASADRSLRGIRVSPPRPPSAFDVRCAEDHSQSEQ
jgi:hypothetical protein